MKRVLILIAIAASLISCKKQEFEPEGPTDVRIRNLSDMDFNEVVVSNRDTTIAFGTILKQGGISGYFRFNKAYSLADITAKINGVTFSTDPVNYTYLDYKGQMRITYEVWISDYAKKKLAINNVIPEEPLVLK